MKEGGSRQSWRGGLVSHGGGDSSVVEGGTRQFIHRANMYGGGTFTKSYSGTEAPYEHWKA